MSDQATPRGRRDALSKDINAILDGWSYEPEEVQVRIVSGADGRDKIQMRLDMGLIQLELTDRPDGTRPEGFDSLLDFYEARVRDNEAAGEPFELDPKAIAALMREGVQFYQRYLAAFQLQRYDLVARDTERNLRLFAFVVRHATRQRDKVLFDQYRPYVTMMRSRALGHKALTRNDYAGALAAIDEGVEGIRQFLRDYEQTDSELECMELGFLLRWRREVEADRPVGPAERLEHQLALAVALEEYEEAARLRDQLHRLKGGQLATKPQTT